MSFRSFCVVLILLLFFTGCTRTDRVNAGPDSSPQGAYAGGEADFSASAISTVSGDREAFVEDFWRWIFIEAGIPENLALNVASLALESPAFVMELLMILEQDPYMHLLVDKQHALAIDYEPNDLVPLGAAAFNVTRDGFSLRRQAAAALSEMTAAAAQDGIVLTVASSYRSGTYQAEVYARWLNQLGREAADRVSARPGHSQHQLGLVVDFFPIDESFANTPASLWLVQNASRFGWSLSYPDGYEHVTGYYWESWHYRYVGRDLALFVNNYFNGIQQYALQFIQAWKEHSGD